MGEVASVGIPSIFGLTGVKTAYKDEDILLGEAQAINFTGDGVVATLVDGVLTVQIYGGEATELVTTLEAVTETDTTHGVAASVIYELGTAFGGALAEKAGLSSPVFTDTPTAPTAEPSSNNSQLATTAYADNAANNGRDDAKTYADGLVINLWDDRGTFDPTAGTWPTSADNGSGVDGAILKGDTWSISVAGILTGGIEVNIGDVIRSLIDGAGNNSTDWGVTENNLGYVAENSANKKTDLSTPNNIDYPTTQAVADGVATREPTLPAAVGAAKFLREDRTWQSILDSVLTGVIFATNAAVVATDSILIAIGKLQKQITDLAANSVTVANNRYTFNAQIGTTYGVVAGDVNAFGSVIVTCTNAAAIAVSIPTPTSLGKSVGDSFNVRQSGAGTVTLSGALQGNLVFNGQHDTRTIIALDANNWMVVGG